MRDTFKNLCKELKMFITKARGNIFL